MGLLDESAACEAAAGSGAALVALVDDMRAGHVQALVVAGVNPVYDTPVALRFADAIAKVPFVASLNDRLDETSQLADVLAPGSHPFECWGDAALPNGVVAVQQPVIQPLFDTRGLLDVLVEWGAAAGDPAAMAAVTAAVAAAKVVPAPATAAPVPSTRAAYHYLRAAWAARLAVPPATPAFEAAWNDVLRTGYHKPPVAAPVADAKVKTDKPAADPGGSGRCGSQGTGRSGPPDNRQPRSRCSPTPRSGGRPRALALPAPGAGRRPRRERRLAPRVPRSESRGLRGAARSRLRPAGSTT